MSNEQGKDEEKGRHHKEITIIVNGREKTVTVKELSYAELVALAFSPIPTGPNVSFTITYQRGEGHKPQGSLTIGESVKIKAGMIFNVVHTDKS